MMQVLAKTLTLLAACLMLAGCDDVAHDEPAVMQAPPAAPVTVVARGNIQFVDGFERGYEQSAREGKPMLVFFTAQWCEFCHQMANEAFIQEQVVGLSQRFVCVLVDADREPAVCRQFQVRGYPTIQFVSPQGVPLNRVVGKKPGHLLVMEMHAALQAVARREAVTGITR